MLVELWVRGVPERPSREGTIERARDRLCRCAGAGASGKRHAASARRVWSCTMFVCWPVCRSGLPPFGMQSTPLKPVTGVLGNSRQSHPHMGRLSVNGPIIVSSHNLRLQGPNGVQIEPVSVLAVPNQNNLTFGQRTWQLHHNPASGGQGSGGRDHSYVRLLKP